MKLVGWQGLNENEVHFNQVLKAPLVGSAARRSLSFIPKGKGASEAEEQGDATEILQHKGMDCKGPSVCAMLSAMRAFRVSVHDKSTFRRKPALC